MSFIVKIFNPSGTLDGFSANQLHYEVRKALQEGADIILIDFQKIEFLKSCCLNALVSILEEVRSQGAELFICSLNDSVRIIFEITKMDLIFKPFLDRNECEKAFISRTTLQYELAKH